MLLESCLEKELCVSNTWSKREEKRKVTLMDMLEGIMMEFTEGRSEELGGKNVIRVLSVEGTMCV